MVPVTTFVYYLRFLINFVSRVLVKKYFPDIPRQDASERRRRRHKLTNTTSRDRCFFLTRFYPNRLKNDAADLKKMV
jgi:hypothetical protein